MGYLASPVNVISSNPCNGPSPRIKISRFLLSACTDEFILAPKRKTLFSLLPSVNKSSERGSNSMP